MGQTERLYKIRHALAAGRCVTPARLQADLEVSPATLKRDIRHLRDRMNTPVRWCRERRGWVLDQAQPQLGTQYELPGLWLSADEVHALLTMQHLLTHLDAGGLLAPPTIKPLDEATLLAACRREGRLVVVAENHSQIGGLGESVAALLMRERVMPSGFRLAGLPDEFLAAGALPTLHDRYGISCEVLSARIRGWLG